MTLRPTKTSHQPFAYDTINIDRSRPEALFRQVEAQLREAIWSGRLRPNERLPSTRQLAKALSVARNTIITAYEQLTVEGFLVSETGSGTRIAINCPEKSLVTEKSKDDLVPKELNEVNVSQRAKNLAKDISSFINKTNFQTSLAFKAHTPDCEQFPQSVWTQISARHLRNRPKDWMASGNPLGYAPLQAALAEYLSVTRGLYAKPQQIIITSGTQQATDLLAKLLTDPGDKVCFEDPGYLPAAKNFEMLGANLQFIPVDDQGIQTPEIEKHSDAKFVYITPANQFPLGSTLSQNRRLSLLSWANKTNTILIEDDFNGEYRYKGRPLTTLYTMDNHQKVIYISSFSHLLYPGLRLGFMVVPESLVDAVKNLRWMSDRHSTYLEQAVLTDFINEGHFARHLRKMRTLYKSKQQHLIYCLRHHFSDYLDVAEMDGGLHLIAWLKDAFNEDIMKQAALKVGIELAFISNFSFNPSKKSAMILGYAPYSEQEIERACLTLKEAFLSLIHKTSEQASNDDLSIARASNS